MYSADSDKFWAQVRHNSREYVGLSLNVPIFNRRRRAQRHPHGAASAVRSQRLALSPKPSCALRKEIEQAWYNADAAYSKYRSAGVALASAEVAFAYEQRKAESGRSTIFDFNDAKTRMEKAEVGSSCRRNTNSYSVRKYWIFTAGNR